MLCTLLLHTSTLYTLSRLDRGACDVAWAVWTTGGSTALPSRDVEPAKAPRRVARPRSTRPPVRLLGLRRHPVRHLLGLSVRPRPTAASPRWQRCKGSAGMRRRHGSRGTRTCPARRDRAVARRPPGVEQHSRSKCSRSKCSRSKCSRGKSSHRALGSIAAATLSSPPPQSGQRGSAPCCAPSMQRSTSSGLVPPRLRVRVRVRLKVRV